MKRSEGVCTSVYLSSSPLAAVSSSMMLSSTSFSLQALLKAPQVSAVVLIQCTNTWILPTLNYMYFKT